MSDFEEEVRPGFTQIPNDLLEKTILFDLTKREYKVIFAVIRKTLGWQKEFDYIASSQIAEMSGLHSSGVRKTIIELTQKGVIIKKGREIGINQLVDEWTNVPKQYANRRKKSVPNQYGEAYQTDTGVYQTDTEKRTKLIHTKETNKPIQKKSLNKRDEEQSEMTFDEEKTTKKPTKRASKKYTGGPPDFVDPENWDAFMEIREIKKAPQTERAIKMLIKKLQKFKNDGQDPDEILCNAVMGGWTSVFPLKVSGKPQEKLPDWVTSDQVDDFAPKLNGNTYEVEH